jgi:hypothetical protein
MAQDVLNTGWLALILTAAAGSPAQVFETLLAGMDTDGSGELDATEYARVDEVGEFSALDTDADGLITATELGRWVRVTQPRPDARLTHRASPEAVLAGAGPRVVPAAPRSSPAPTPASSRSLRLALFGAVVLIGGLGSGLMLGRRNRRRR